MADEIAQAPSGGNTGTIILVIGGLAVLAVGGYAAYLFLNKQTLPVGAQITPTLSSNPTSVVAGVGTNITITGQGYTPNNTVSLSGTAGTTTIQNTGANGTFTAGPYNSNDTTSTPQNVTFTGTDTATGISATCTVQFTSGGGGGNPGTIDFTVSPDSVSYNSSGIYTPTSLAINGSGFTALGNVKIYDEVNDLLATYTAGPAGNLNESLPISSFNPGAGTGYIYAFDVGSGNYSTQVAMTYTSTTSSTNLPGTILPPSDWTSTGNYGYNTNPVPFGQWAVLSGSLYNVQFTAGPGYYENSSGTQEMYFGSSSAALSWLTSNGYQTIQNNPLGSQNNPFVNQSSYQGVGYYSGSGYTEQYVSNSTQFNNLLATGNTNPPVGSSINPWTLPVGIGPLFSWNGNGYYMIPNSVEFAELPAGIKSVFPLGQPILVSNESTITNVNALLQAYWNPVVGGGGGGTSISVEPNPFNTSGNSTFLITGSGFNHYATINFTLSHNGQYGGLPATATTTIAGVFSIPFTYPGSGAFDSLVQGWGSGTMTITATDGTNSASTTCQLIS